MIADWNINFHIMMGLPGSGKTYYCNTCTNHSDWQTLYLYIDLDTVDKDDCLGIEDVLRYAFIKNNLTTPVFYDDTKTREVYIDGLILTNDVLQNVLKVCIDYITDYQGHVGFNIHVWNDDRETCIRNDGYRLKSGQRSESAAITIRNAKFDNVNKQNIERIVSGLTEKIYPVDVIKHDVYKMTTYNSIIEPFENGWKEKGYLVSDSWSGGGTCGSCWSDELSIVESDPVPEFIEFDNMLAEICPSISFLQYKRLCRTCVTTESRQESDYYGGCETRMWHQCDLKKLYNELVEMRLIEA